VRSCRSRRSQESWTVATGRPRAPYNAASFVW
jgi:hypothetical protein